MTIEQICCVSFGVVLQSMTFALGIVVGASMRRKEPLHDRPSESRACGTDAAGRGVVGGVACKFAVDRKENQRTETQGSASQRMDAAGR